MALNDNSDLDFSVAKASRPARQLKAKFSEGKRNKKKPGPARKQEPPSNTKYTNWQTAFLWQKIRQAAARAGPQMSATKIVEEAKRIDPILFGNLTRSTVWGWIDMSGVKPKWKESILERVKRNNDVGHSKGGCIGVLVRLYYASDEHFSDEV
jgi:hypothetical protein